MLTKAELKNYTSLLSKKGRKEIKKFIVEGHKLILEALNSNFKCDLILHTSSFEEEHKEFIKKIKVNADKVECIKKNDLNKLCDTVNPQEVLGIFRIPEPKLIIPEGNLIVALETINDPGNLGTIIRNCDWFGVNTIIMSSDCAEVFNSKVIRSSAGSVFHLNLIEKEDFYKYIHELKRNKYKIVCADLDGEILKTYKADSKTILVLANEANGPSNPILKLTDRKITIPKKGKAESLNVSNASAVLLYELTKH